MLVASDPVEFRRIFVPPHCGGMEISMKQQNKRAVSVEGGSPLNVYGLVSASLVRLVFSLLITLEVDFMRPL